MSKCSITIPLSVPAEQLVSKAQTAISAAGGRFSGDAAGGDFKINTPLGAISGTYSIMDNEMAVSIADKPFLVGCGTIEKELRKHLGI